jgi:hypothetical protein
MTLARIQMSVFVRTTGVSNDWRVDEPEHPDLHPVSRASGGRKQLGAKSSLSSAPFLGPG